MERSKQDEGSGSGRKILEAMRQALPFGIGVDKPRHFRDMGRVLWENRDSLGYAWRILNHGVCDGCSLGPRGLQDDVIEGTHLCMSRLKLLRLNTMPAIADEVLFGDIERLRAMTNEELHKLGRLPYPMVYRPGTRGFVRLSWDEAARLAADALRATEPDRAAMFVTSRGLTNESYYALQKFMRMYGTNNVDLCARLCHAATVSGLQATLGVKAPTLSLVDLIGTDILFLFGTDLVNNQPVSAKYLHYAKKAGTHVVVINPLREKGLERYWVPSVTESAIFGTKIMDELVQVKIGGDIALINGMLKAMDELATARPEHPRDADELELARQVFAHDFIARHTTGFEALLERVRAQSWSELERISGVDEATMRALGARYARARSAVFVYSMGLTQHQFGVENVQAIVNLALSRGMLGREKCGILPIRGHSGVQGGGELAVSPSGLPNGMAVGPEGAAALAAEWGGFPLPTEAGLDTGAQIHAAYEGALDVLYSVGGNLLETMPDRAYTKAALENVKVRIHQDIVLNTSTLLEAREAVLVLPARTRYEQRGGGTSTNTERRVRYSPEIPGPRIGETLEEFLIPAVIARELMPEKASEFAWSDAQDVREEIGRVVPLYRGIETLTAEGQWIQPGGPQLCTDGFPNMPDGRARFTPLDPPEIHVPEGRFYLTTRRGKQFNSMTFGEVDAQQGTKRRDVVFICRRDARRLGVRPGERVIVRSEIGQMEARVHLDDVTPGALVAYWPEANVLITNRYDPVSREPDYNALVEIVKVDG